MFNLITITFCFQPLPKARKIALTKPVEPLPWKLLQLLSHRRNVPPCALRAELT